MSRQCRTIGQIPSMNCRSPPGPCANWLKAATDLPPPPGVVRFDTVGRLIMLVEERGIHWKIWKTYVGTSQTVTNCEMKSFPRWSALKENLRGGMSQNFETTHDISRRCLKNDSLWPFRVSKSGWAEGGYGVSLQSTKWDSMFSHGRCFNRNCSNFGLKPPPGQHRHLSTC